MRKPERPEPTAEQIAAFERAMDAHRKFTLGIPKRIDTSAESMFRRQNPGR